MNESNTPQSKKKKKITCMEDVRTLPKKEQTKYEIAEELGIIDKVFQSGWRSLSAKESGRIGGIIRSRNAQMAASQDAENTSGSASINPDKQKE